MKLNCLYVHIDRSIESFLAKDIMDIKMTWSLRYSRLRDKYYRMLIERTIGIDIGGTFPNAHLSKIVFLTAAMSLVFVRVAPRYAPCATGRRPAQYRFASLPTPKAANLLPRQIY